ncbi:hypothetical protein Tco_0823156 [Tanacetum coccineum]|uniref:Reverse transcriptase domain-containing protein n=1 Tax=Tanacetum coccineum TaxID=301880 RepID=A0ABQ5AK45_9ASTR
MPPRRNMNFNDVYERNMARMEEQLDQFVDQFANRMNDMMNPRRRGDRNDRRNKGGESENPFFEGDGSSLFAELEEWEGDGVADDNYEKAPVFDDDQYEEEIVSEFVGKGFVDKYLDFQEDENNVSFSGVVLGVEEESMQIYDTDIEDAIKEEEGFVGKGGFGGEEDSIEDVVVVANDLCSSTKQPTLSVDFEEDINTKSYELMSFGKSIIIKGMEEEYPFVNKYPSFQEEPIVLVKEESCPVYDTDNEEE